MQAILLGHHFGRLQPLPYSMGNAHLPLLTHRKLIAPTIPDGWWQVTSARSSATIKKISRGIKLCIFFTAFGKASIHTVN